ncbi:MAG: plastocyanin/azurin family copper-binding protein [Actinomycetota bacterium]
MAVLRFVLPVLAAALAVTGSACTGGAGGVQEVEISVHHSRFRPERALLFRTGDTVTFKLVNDDPIDHEFILGDEAVQQRHEDGTEMMHDQIPTEVSLPAGQTVTTTITFGEAGSMILGCHLPGHYAFGMRTTLEVV